MNNIRLKLFLIIFLGHFVIAGSSNGQMLRRNAGRNVEKELFGKTIDNKKGKKSKAPKSGAKSKKKQEADERRRKKDYNKSIKQSQKRTMDIQSPDVQERMKQNKKDSAARDKMKKKKSKSAGKKAAKKYK